MISRDTRFVLQRKRAFDPNVRLRFLPGGADQSIVAQGYANGSLGETLNFTRSGAALAAGNGGVVTSVATGKPRIEAKGLLCEPPATNLALYCRDLTNAAWTASNATVAKTATGADGTANGASTVTATAGNATVLQAITVAAATRATSLYIKRRTGTGAIQVTRDNGTTWTAVTSSLSSTAWFRVTPATHSAMSSGGANPTVGIRIVTSGDAVDVDFVQDEAGATATSPIITTSASASRNADIAYIVPPKLPGAIGSVAFDYTPLGSSINGIIFLDTRAAGSTGPGFSIEGATATVLNFHTTTGSSSNDLVSSALSWTPGTTYRICCTWNATVAKIFRNGVQVASGSSFVSPAGMPRVYINCRSDGAGYGQGNLSNLILASSETGAR